LKTCSLAHTESNPSFSAPTA